LTTNLDVEGSFDLHVVLILGQPAFTVEHVLLVVAVVDHLHVIHVPGRAEARVVVANTDLVDVAEISCLQFKHVNLSKSMVC